MKDYRPIAGPGNKVRKENLLIIELLEDSPGPLSSDPPSPGPHLEYRFGEIPGSEDPGDGVIRLGGGNIIFQEDRAPAPYRVNQGSGFLVITIAGKMIGPGGIQKNENNIGGRESVIFLNPRYRRGADKI